MDERYKEDKLKAHMAANKVALSIIFFTTLILRQGKLMGKLECSQSANAQNWKSVRA